MNYYVGNMNYSIDSTNRLWLNAIVRTVHIGLREYATNLAAT